MENLIFIRDAIFWWVGNWALFTALDAAIIGAIWKARETRKERAVRVPALDAAAQEEDDFYDDEI